MQTGKLNPLFHTLEDLVNRGCSQFSSIVNPGPLYYRASALLIELGQHKFVCQSESLKS